MSKNDFSRLFDQLESLSVGFGPVFRDLQINNNGYPPHNIVSVSDSEFFIELAIAGFKKSEIQMEEHQGTLTIKGEKAAAQDANPYQYKGIANRSFSKSFRVAEYFEVRSATMEDGILTVSFVRNIPDAAKPKLIAIN